ncbi:MAG: polysaccharide deacetylase family protein [Clostridia bacterium]|nr:polysaccharide deacetylase family protein [Clostridia bacterium]
MLKIFKALAQKIIYCPDSSVILLFHHLSLIPEFDKSGCKLDTASFERMISKYDNYVSLPELLNGHEKNRIAVTFDDGLSDVYNIGYRYLRQRNIPFTVFVLTDFLDTEGYITTEQLREMANDPLVTIGAHGTSHRILKGLSTEEKMAEMVNSKNILEHLTGQKVTIFAYSHGQYDGECMKILRRVGYSFAMSVERYPYNIFTRYRRYRIPRVNVDTADIEKAEHILERILKRC